MRNLNYREIPSALGNMNPFSGNTMSGGYDRNGTYTVWSYDTVIATVEDTDSGYRTWIPLTIGVRLPVGISTCARPIFPVA